MSTRKTQQTKSSASAFVDNVENNTRRSDAKVVMKLMRGISRKNAKMWGPSIIGYGISYYTLASGKTESICKIGFSPRSQALVFYLGNFKGRETLLKKLGKHKLGSGGCLYINKLKDVDLGVLEEMISRAYHHVKPAS